MKHQFLKKSVSIVCIAVIVASFLTLQASAKSTAEIPTDSYSYWVTGENDSDRRSVYTRPMYTVSRVIDNTTLGVSAFTELTDVCCDSKSQTYLLDGEAGKIYVLNSDYSFKCEISAVSDGETEYTFVGAKGIYVTEDGRIFIADTENARILICDELGVSVNVLTKPNTDIIPEEFKYRPIKVAADSKGYLYVISEGSYYGAIKYSPSNEFLGFYGSNSVGGSVMEAFKKVWDMLVNNNAKRSAAMKRLPYQFVDLAVDSEDTVYTITGHTSGSATSTAQIKKFSIGGTNILRRTTSLGSLSSESINFGEPEISKYAGVSRIQDFLGIAVSQDKYIYGLDSTYGKIYVYDSQCNLMTVFGGGVGTGNQKGTFKLAEAIALNGKQVLVCDAGKNSVTVFELTEYGSLVMQAQSLTLNGDYIEAEPIWKQVIASDANNQLAYRGIAKARYYDKDYTAALSYAKDGNDKDIYSQAFEYVRGDYLSRNFWWIAVSVLLIIAAVAAMLIYTARKKVTIIKNKFLRTLLRAPIHPFESFHNVKYSSGGSVPLAVLSVLLWYVFSVLAYTNGGFLYTEFNADSFNALFVLAKTVGLALLWSVVNWGVCTLLDGKGKFRQVFIVAAYSTIPMTAGRILFLILSNTMTLEQHTALEIVSALAVIIAGIMLCIGSIVIHDYSFGKFAGTAVLTLLGMVLVVFILFMLIVLLQQFYIFASTVFMEAFYR